MMVSFELTSLDLKNKQAQTKLNWALKTWPQILKQYRQRWLRSNRSGGLDESIALFENIHQGVLLLSENKR
jgi:hypothetical protein